MGKILLRALKTRLRLEQDKHHWKSCWRFTFQNLDRNTFTGVSEEMTHLDPKRTLSTGSKRD
jgi:hypothetical protein